MSPPINPDVYVNAVLSEVEDLQLVPQLGADNQHIQGCCNACERTFFVPIRPAPEAIAQGAQFGYALVGHPYRCVRWMPYPWDQIGHPEIEFAGVDKKWKKSRGKWKQVAHRPLLFRSSDLFCHETR